MPSILLPGVIHQRQLTPRACWFTCLQMAVRYFQNKSAASLAGLSSPENFDDMLARFNSGGNPTWDEWREWAQRCGFKPMDMTPTAGGVYEFLGQRGPIIYSGTWGNTFDGHVVIIVGVDTDANTIQVDNPLDASAPSSRNYDSFMGQLMQTLTDNPLFVR